MKNFKLVSILCAPTLVLGAAIGLAAAARPTPAPRPGGEVQLSIAKIYWEYNATANDLGVHVSLDGEDWKQLRIENPKGLTLFEVKGMGPYKEFGMTELFFEGAEPSLDDVPLEVLLAKFPEGEYEFEGKTVDGAEIEGEDLFDHDIPAGPDVFSSIGSNNFLQIDWTAVDGPPPGFPNQDIEVVAYQVIVESFQVTVPATVLSMTIPPEFVGTLAAGEHQFEVLAIEASGNQTLTEGSFVK